MQISVKQLLAKQLTESENHQDCGLIFHGSVLTTSKLDERSGTNKDGPWNVVTHLAEVHGGGVTYSIRERIFDPEKQAVSFLKKGDPVILHIKKVMIGRQKLDTNSKGAAVMADQCVILEFEVLENVQVTIKKAAAGAA